MPFYGFKLSGLHIGTPRGKVPDNDIVTYGVTVNQVDQGGGAGLFPALATGAKVPAASCLATTARGTMPRDLIVGPLEILPGDAVNVSYSGTNVSDTELTQGDTEKIEIKILDSMFSAAVGAIGGEIGAALTGALGLISDPAVAFLGRARRPYL